MPLYEYRCPNGHEFERFFRSIGSAAVEAKCPTCGELGERVLSTAGLVFKGSGFYITDYGKDGKGPRKPESESTPASETKSSEAKPEKAETKASSKPETSPGKSSSRPTKGKAASE